MNAIEVRGAEVSYGAHKVLSALDLDVGQGEFLVLLGASGCGKSTLLNAIAGLIDLSDGEIWIDGRNVTWEEPVDRKIGMVFQSYALYPRMSVEQNMSFGLRMAGVERGEIARRVARAAEILRLGELLKRRPAELSGGQRQRVAIGRALVRDVSVFLFDEPLSNLDAKLRTELRVEIKKLHQDLGNTMIYVTHDQVEAMTLADRIAVMRDGRIEQLASPEEIYSRPVNRFVAGFVGSPGMNFLPARLTRAEGGLTAAGEGLGVDLAAAAFAVAPSADQEVEIGVRPEHFVLGGAAAGMALSATLKVDVIENMGADRYAWGRIGAHPAAARVPLGLALKAGDTVAVGVPTELVAVFDAASGMRLQT